MGCITSISSTDTADVDNTVNRKQKLLNLTLKDTKQFSFDGMIEQAKVVSCYDGDTFRAAFYYKDEIVQSSCRMLGYDSPEMKISKTNPNRDKLKDLAIKARDRLRELLLMPKEDGTCGGLVVIHFGKNDLYGRPLVDVYADGKHVNAIMLDEGHGKPYLGGTKEEW
jgi:micrococcal nuclease